MRSWTWQWPLVGPTPITEGLDSEIFDRTDFPYSETFVREAIQNSLDARIHTDDHVKVNFLFHTTDDAKLAPLLDQVITYRKKCHLDIPDEWSQNEIKWLVVQDFRATGLCGDLARRTSDFWNYWLNFGQSNKTGIGRGGRGIGRVTFLISSQINTVIGYTRRHEDHATPICGMSVLRSIEDQSNLRSTHAYLAREPIGSIYSLHTSPEFSKVVINGFNLQDYESESETGLALAIPYPHRELSHDSILAAAIENFAPCIIDNSLRLNVDGTSLDDKSIDSIANRVAGQIRNKSIQEDPMRYLSLVRTGVSPPIKQYRLRIDDTTQSIHQRSNREVAERAAVQIQASTSSPRIIDLKLPLLRNNKSRETSLKAVIGRTPEGVTPLDRFFRDGMCLPKVKSANPSDLDLLLFVEDRELSKYLNFCEGKAHLDLARSKAITQKLRAEKYGRPLYFVRDLVKSLPNELRRLLEGDLSEPDSGVFEDFFSVPARDRQRTTPNVDGTPPPSPLPPDPQPKPFRVVRYKSGVRVIAAKHFDAWPVDLRARLAYDDGRRLPTWEKADFDLAKLDIRHSGCRTLSANGRDVIARSCDDDFALIIVGFDCKRELVVNWTFEKAENAEDH